MRVRISTYWLSFIVAAIFAVIFNSCKSPNAPTTPSPAPVLSITIPDSARVFDTVTFRAHYSDSIHTGWKFEWQFGDSAKASTKDTSISHVYDSAGTYTVLVSLVDTSGKTIATQTALMKINVPLLTLSIPATNFWGDSCVMSVQSSQPLRLGWKYTWTFGDSSSISLWQTTILHYFLIPGNLTVRVDLNDTVHHILLASRTATIQVVARHFNLTLLQSMKYVDITAQAIWTVSAISNFGDLCNGRTYLFWDSIFSSSYGSLLWEGLDCNYNNRGTTILNDTPFTKITTTLQSSLSANVDSNFSQVSFDDSEYSFIDMISYSPGGLFCTQQTHSQISFSHIPFLRQSDSETVFEYRGNLQNIAFITSSATSLTPNYFPNNASENIEAVWDKFSYIIIRFHK